MSRLQRAKIVKIDAMPFKVILRVNAEVPPYFPGNFNRNWKKMQVYYYFCLLQLELK